MKGGPVERSSAGQSARAPKVLDVTARRLERVRYRLQAKWARRVAPGRWTDASFDKLLQVDPATIREYGDIRLWRHRSLVPYGRGRAGAKSYVMANTGKVLGGEWDLQVSPFEENDIYRLLYEHFVLGIPWQECEVYRRFAAEIERGERRWHWSSNLEELRAAAAEVEELHRRIRDEGYVGKSRKGRASLDEITVSIARDGRLIYNNVGGHHRLSIAKILRVERVPVRVLLRHREWQAVRDACRKGDAGAQYRSHPDLRDLLAGQR